MDAKQDNSSITFNDFYLGDPLAKFIITRLKWKPIKTGIIMTVYAFLTSVILASINKRLLPGNGYISLVTDWSYIITELFTNPVVWGYYVWSCIVPIQVIQNLQKAEIITIAEQKVQSANKVLKNKNWPWCALGLAALIGYSYLTGSIDWLENPATFFLRVLLVVLPGAYAVWMIIFRIIAATRVFKRVMDEMSLHPLHPDKVGGLQPLGDYAFKITWAIILAGIMGALLEISDILRNVSGEGYFVHGTFLLYLILAPFVFFYPLSIAHQSMKKAKSNFLLTVSKEFNQNISEVHSEIKIQSLDLSKDYDLSDNILRIEQLQKLHDIGDSFPVWPFDFANIRRFSVSMLSPIFTFAAPFFLKFVLIPLLEPVLSQKAFEKLMNILENL